jgi:hypothetical protein
MSDLRDYYRLVKWEGAPRPNYDELNRMPEGMYHADYTYYVFTCNKMKFILRSELPYTEKIVIDTGIGVIYTSLANIFMRDATSMLTRNFTIYRMYNLHEIKAKELLTKFKGSEIFASSENAYTIIVAENIYGVEDKHRKKMLCKWSDLVYYYSQKDPITYPIKPTGSFTKPACRDD